jgi:PST family polysaccharide transporter
MSLSIMMALISIGSFAIGINWGAVGVAAVSAISFTFIQVPIMVRAMTRIGPVRQQDIAKAMLPFVVSPLFVAAPLWYLRETSGAAGLAGVAALVYGLFGLCVLLLPGGRDFFATVMSMRSSLQFPRAKNASSA